MSVKNTGTDSAAQYSHKSPVRSSFVLACELIQEVDEISPGPGGVVSST